MSAQNTLTSASAKTRARALQESLRKHGLEAKLSLCYELLAAAHGQPNWNVLSAKIPQTKPTFEPSLTRRLREAVSGHERANEIVAAFEQGAPVMIPGTEAPWGYPIDRGQVGLVVKMSADAHPLGRMVTFLAGEGGALSARRGFGGSGAKEPRTGDFDTIHPRSWYMRQAMRQYAMAIPDESGLVILKGDLREEIETILIERAAQAVEGFLGTYSPDRLALARETECWNIFALERALTKPDPVKFLQRAGRYQWLLQELEERPSSQGSRSLVEEFDRDPHATYARWLRKHSGYFWKREPVLNIGMNWLGVDTKGRAPLSQRALKEETVAFDYLGTMHPRLDLESETGLVGSMMYLMKFRDIGRPLEKGDLKGLPEAVADFEDAVAGCCLDNFRGCSVWDRNAMSWAESKYAEPFVKALSAHTNPWLAKKLVEGGRLSWKIRSAGLKKFVRENGIPATLTLLAEGIRRTDPAYDDRWKDRIPDCFAGVPHLDVVLACMKAAQDEFMRSGPDAKTDAAEILRPERTGRA